MRTSNFPVTLVMAAVVGIGGTAAATVADTPERIAADTARTTVAGNTFVAPAGWSLVVRGPATILEAPEGGSFIVLVDVPRRTPRMPTPRSPPRGRRTSPTRSGRSR